MSIFTLSYSIFTERLTPPSKRVARFLAWLRALTSPLQWLHGNVLDTYADGDFAADWDVATQYAIYDRIRYEDGSIYEAIALPPLATIPTITTYWYKVAESWIGANERTVYNSQSLMFEYAANKHFNTTFRQPNDVSSPTRSEIYTSNDNGNIPFAVSLTSDISDAVYISEALATNAVYEAYTVTTTNFTLYIPLVTFTALGTDNTIRESKARAFADKYIIAGMIYTVTPY